MDDDHMDDDDDDAPWTLAQLAYGVGDSTDMPDRATTLRLLRELHAQWTVRDMSIERLVGWVCDRFEVNPRDFKWADFDKAFLEESYKRTRIEVFMEQHRIDDEDALKLLHELADVMYSVRDMLKHTTRLLSNMSPELETMRAIMPPEVVKNLQKLNENVIVHDEKGNTNFQNCFLHLRHILQSCAYRRSGGSFFQRVLLPDGTETMAFEEAIEIKRFVSDNTSYDLHFQAWRWITNPHSNYDNMVEFLTKRPIAEAPDLVEKRNLRSYAGDRFGRGAGVYDALSDMFFPYAVRHLWAEMADHVQRLRRATDPAYACEAPKPQDVCVVHIDAAFPFDILAEVTEVAAAQLGTRWRVAHAFEVGPCHEVPVEVGAWLGPKLAAELPDAAAPLSVPPLGAHWVVVGEGASQGEALSEPSEIADALRRKVYDFTEQQLVRHRVTEDTYVDLGNGLYAMPALPTPRCRRAVLSDSDARALRGHITASSYVAVDDGNGGRRYFVPDSGRTWEECDCAEIDHIFYCQQFTLYDYFMIYGLLGRLFFEVGELDLHEMTLFFMGIGGCGKSTILKAMFAFWPAYLRAILSSNMQSQFGMSSLAHGAVCFCSEVSADLNLPQEEFQDATGGAVLSMARKFQDPLVQKWRSQFLWAGNQPPLRWKNTAMQVSRRIAGVRMLYPVRPRDGSISVRIAAKQGSLNRKVILAYAQCRRVWGTTDPMSQPDKLPPAFADYYRTSLRLTDPIEDFLCDDEFIVKDKDEYVRLDHFKELYTQYRSKNELKTDISKFSEERCANAFSNNGLYIEKMSSFVVDGVEYRDVKVISGIKALK